jgi:CheY-like chemotaxis protein
MTQHLLEKEGIKVEKTTYPKEALQYLQNTTYNLVFSDIQMPEMDGFELVRQIRNLNQNQTLPVVALSANAHFQKSDYIQQGFDTYLSKPFSALALFQVIHELTGFAIPQTLIQPKQAIHSNDNQTYTLKNIQRFTDNNPETLRSILQAFTSSTQEHLLLLEQYLEARKYDDISRLAHKMLPMFRQLEAQLCIEPLETLERKTQYDLSTTEIEKLTQRSIEQIRKLLQLIP